MTELPILAFTILTSVLAQFGVDIPANIANLIKGLTPAITSLINDLRNGGTPSEETVTVLQDLLPVIGLVQADTSLDPKYTEWAGLLAEMIANVMLADADARKLVDPTKLHEA